MDIRISDILPQDAKDIRIAVFVDEQGFYDEFDKDDDASVHLVAYIENKAAATARVFFDKVQNRYIIGRIAVVKEQRKNGLGAEIVRAAENVIKERGGGTAYIHAQQRAVGFYRKIGYTSFGETELEQGYPHTWMKKALKP